MTENIAEDLNFLRSLLHSDDDLQIRSSGDFNQVCLKLNFDIQINFFVEPSANSLTIDNLHDVRIYKVSNKTFLKQDQWINLQDYFNQLIQQSNSDTSFYSILQLIQEKLSQPINRSNSVSKKDASTVVQKFRGADLIFNCIAYGPAIDRSTDNQLNLMQGLYHFNSSTNQWILYSSELSKDHTYLPERCQLVTWNILSPNRQSEYLYLGERYREIFRTLQSFLPDIICLQEVTRTFLDLLFEENWLRENNYYVIMMENILDMNENQSNGQLMLMKNFRPQSFQICSSEKLRINQNYLIARFGLNAYVTIDLIHLHLNISHEQRSEILEYLFKTMNRQNYMIIGDLNVGDDDIIEENILQKSKYQIHDLWKDIYDLDENPGYTIDPITSNSSVGLRSDRYLLHKIPNLSYSIIHLNMIGLESTRIDDKHINQSNHYGLKLTIHFRIRSISDRSALVLLPTGDISSLRNPCLESMTLFRPFFDLMDTEDDEENILLPLRLLLAQYSSFEIENNSSIDNTFSAGKSNEPSTKSIQQLSEQIEKLFPQCGLDHSNPSMTIAQKHLNQSIQYIYILQQSSEDETTQFHITHQIPLGSVLESIGLHRLDCISDEIGELFTRRNLYNDEKLFEQKQEKFNRLVHCFDGVFNKDTIHYFTYAFFPYGSFRLGLHGEDLDTVFVLSEEKCVKKKTNLDQSLLQLRYDPLALNNHIIDLLERYILDDLKKEIIDCRKIQALYPILSILFHDQTRVEIFVQVIFNDQTEEKRNLLLNFHEPIHGVHDIERLITYVRFPSIFQHLLTFIRTWAQNNGLYGQVYGYLGGYSWAILCAYICRRYISLIRSPFSIEQFYILIEKFFSTYSDFNWTGEAFSVYPNHSSRDNRGSMRILCPNPPFSNTARSTTDSTRYLIIQGFRNACERNCEDILRLSNRFPDSTIQSILQLTLSGQTINELNQWLGYMKSRLAHFLTDCEEECHLFVQTDNQIERREKVPERFYSIGFQLNEQILSRHREFYYSLNRFLEQFKSCLFRSETMKISYKLMSIHLWKTERLRK